MAWRGKRNGDLLRAIVGHGFDVLLTVDRNIPYQQNLRAGGIALVVLASGGTTLSDLVPLMPSTLAVLATIKPGEMVEVTA